MKFRTRRTDGPPMRGLVVGLAALAALLQGGQGACLVMADDLVVT